MLCVAMAVGAYAGTNTTGDLSLYKPAVDETGWGANVNTNMDTIDAQVTDLNKGVWKAEAAFGNGDTTPTIGSGGLFRTANTGATSITDFDDPEDNPIIVVRIADANTTIVDGSGIELISNANELAASGDVYLFYYDGTDYRQIGAFDPARYATYTANNAYGYNSICPSGTLYGDGSDGAGPTSTGNLDTGDGKEYSTWNITASNTITLTNGSSVASEYGYHYVCVSGTLTLNSSSKIVLDGTANNGAAAGAVGPGIQGGGTNDAGSAGGGGGGAKRAVYEGDAHFGGDGGGARGGRGGVDQIHDPEEPNNHASAFDSADTNDGQPGLDAHTGGLWYYGGVNLGPGAGGGSGADGTSCVPGIGGDGGGLLIIEANTLNFVATAEISAKGDAGGTANGTSCGNGGGGGGGTVVILAQTITSQAGTITVTKGSGNTGVGTHDGGDGGTGRSKIVDL